jgi:hypothetical protein
MFNNLFLKYYTDNIELNLGSGGKTIATDDISGIQHELVKVEFGVDGAATMVSAANPLPVTDALGATAAKQDTGNTSLASIDTKLTSPLTVQATNLDIRDLVFATDKVDASGTVLGAGAAVIGHVIADTGSTTAVTGNVTVVQGTGSNLHAVLDASSAVIGHVINDAGSAIIGKVGIDQTTPGTTNLVALTAETTKVIGTINIAAAQTLATVTTVGAVTAITNALPTGTNNVGSVNLLPDATATYAPTNATSTAYEASRIIKGSAGVLISILGYNSKTATQFIQLHNTTTVPADTAVPVAIFAVPASSNFSLDFIPYGRFFSTGITICNSSTGPTKTIGSADCWFDIQYK